MTPLRSAISALECVRDDRRQRRILVGFSGGKDSIVTLRLAVRVFGAENVSAFHMRIVPGIECVEGHARGIAERLGVTFRSYPDPDSIRALKRGIYCPPVLSIGRLPKYRDIEAQALADADCDWTALGWRKSDNYSRLFVLRPGLVGPPKSPRRVFPVGDWKDVDIYGAIRAWGERPVPAFRTSTVARGSGVSLNPVVLAQVKQQYPADYRRILEVFPYADAAVWRVENALPVGDRGDVEPEGDPRGGLQPQDDRPDSP